jgi:hypothetical protein
MDDGTVLLFLVGNRHVGWLAANVHCECMALCALCFSECSLCFPIGPMNHRLCIPGFVFNASIGVERRK